MSELLEVLMAWAVVLMGVPVPNVEPMIVYKPHSFFVETSCGGKECNVVGLYTDETIIYIDERLQKLDTPLARSIHVHEFVHFLQHMNGEAMPQTCDNVAKREREAYAVQTVYTVRNEATVQLPMPSPAICRGL